MKDESSVYSALVRAVREAGFFSNGIEDMGDWDRTVICAKRKPDGRGFAGNSFWVTHKSGKWFVGAWGGSVYRVVDTERLAEFCITWLKRYPATTQSDFDECFTREFSLIRLTGEEFADTVGRTKERE